MFDPEMLLYPRLANECGLKRNSFAPKRECDEQELKYLNLGGTTTFNRIINAIHAQPNRIVDTTQWTRNEYALITFNYDTTDQRLAQNGYSLRVRCSLTKNGGVFDTSQIDMCIKTIMPTGRNVVLFDQTRGEWETELPRLQPDMGRMIEENRRKKPPLPDFFKNGGVSEKELFVESIGCSLRSIFPSYEIIDRGNHVKVAEFQHTQDKNMFMTPYGDVVTTSDDEAEAEFLGIHGLEENEISADSYEKLMRHCMKSLDRLIVTADSVNISRNLLSKAVRARNALEGVYGPDMDTALAQAFNLDQRIEEASRFSLSQHMQAEDVSLDNLWRHVGHLRAREEYLAEKPERNRVPKINPFQFAKLSR